MSTENMSFMDKFMGVMDKITGPMTRFGQIPFIRAITNGMVASIGITMIGSIFLIFNLLGTDGGGLTEKAILPFLKPISSQLSLVNSLSMGIMAVYMAIAMGAEYAEIKGFNKTTGAIGSFFGFILLNYASIAITADEVNALTINNWGGGGVITSIIAAAISVNVIHLCYKYNLRIKLPDSVPPAVADSFSAIIPYFFIVIICWGIRTLLGFDIPTMVTQILLPFFSAADNIFTFTLAYFFVSLFWICGIHGDNVVGAVTNAFTNTWMIENAAAGAANQVIPYIWVPNTNRLFMWASSCGPILVYMFMSSKKLPHLKPLGMISIPPFICGIIEPIMFGLPVVLNPFLAIPFVLSHTVTAALSYWLTSIDVIGRFYLNLPWAMPAPILNYLSTGGSFMAAVMYFISFGIGLLIFYPFWKAYEKSEVKRMEEESQAMAEVE